MERKAGRVYPNSGEQQGAVIERIRVAANRVAREHKLTFDEQIALVVNRIFVYPDLIFSKDPIPSLTKRLQETYPWIDSAETERLLEIAEELYNKGVGKDFDQELSGLIFQAQQEKIKNAKTNKKKAKR